MNFYYRSRWHWWRRRTQRSRRTRRIIKKTSVNFGIFLKFSTTNHSRLLHRKIPRNNKWKKPNFPSNCYATKNLATLQQIRRCFFTRKKNRKSNQLSARKCVFQSEIIPNFWVVCQLMGVATPFPPSQYACLPARHAHVWTYPPSVIFGWENKWLMRYSCHFPVILFSFFLASMNM